MSDQAMETIEVGGCGAAVEDVQRRLVKLGYGLGAAGTDGIFAGATAQAVEAFRRDHGLPEGDSIDALAWAALVDASFTLGERTLYLRMPYFHGNDVHELQHILNILGFACGVEDSIFGAYTERAVRDFQTNMGLESDGIVGATTCHALTRLHRAWSDKNPIASDAPGLGFSRAADVLERTPLCIYGTDVASREIASRVANLAFATTRASRLVSADTLSGVLDPSMIFVEVEVEAEADEADAADSPDAARIFESHDDARADGRPVVEFDDAATLTKRFATAVSALGDDARRMVVRVRIPAKWGDDPNDSVNEGSRRGAIQHNAILILDAICEAFS